MNDRFKFRTYIPDLKFFKYWGWVEEWHYVNMCACGDYSMSELLKNYTDQCTGLKDKNGKLIYEGDIVKFKTELFGKPKQIIWDECHYILKDTFIILCDMEIKQFGLEVIGNIYENKSLLESDGWE